MRRGKGDHDDGDDRVGADDLMPHTCHYSKPDRHRRHPRIPGAFARVERCQRHSEDIGPNRSRTNTN